MEKLLERMKGFAESLREGFSSINIASIRSRLPFLAFLVVTGYGLPSTSQDSCDASIAAEMQRSVTEGDVHLKNLELAKAREKYRQAKKDYNRSFLKDYCLQPSHDQAQCDEPFSLLKTAEAGLQTVKRILEEYKAKCYSTIEMVEQNQNLKPQDKIHALDTDCYQERVIRLRGDMHLRFYLARSKAYLQENNFVAAKADAEKAQKSYEDGENWCKQGQSRDINTCNAIKGSQERIAKTMARIERGEKKVKRPEAKIEPRQKPTTQEVQKPPLAAEASDSQIEISTPQVEQSNYTTISRDRTPDRHESTLRTRGILFPEKYWDTTTIPGHEYTTEHEHIARYAYLHLKIRNRSCALARVSATADFQFAQGLREFVRDLNDINCGLKRLQGKDCDEEEAKKLAVDTSASDWIYVSAQNEKILSIQLDTANVFGTPRRLRSGKVQSIDISWPNGRSCP